jgi:pilus assembly protein CpaC
MGTGTVLLTGTVGAPEDAAEAERLVQAFLGKEANVISRLKTATPLQVNLHVKFAEVSRSLVREIAGSLQTADATNGFRFGVGTGRSIGGGEFSYGGPLGVGSGASQTALVLPDGTEVIGPSIDSLGGTTIGGLGQLFGLNMLGALDISERLGLVTTITEPNLTALSGETATFLAGGEFPIPIGGFGEAGQLADWVVFMLSDSADFLCGSVVFVDGGSDAYFRPDDWPRAVPARRLLSYLRRTRQYSQRSQP